MSLRSDNRYHCDRCGADLDNGRASIATKITGRDPDDPFRLRQLDLCVAEREGAPFGCTGNLLGAASLANYYETRTA